MSKRISLYGLGPWMLRILQPMDQKASQLKQLRKRPVKKTWKIPALREFTHEISVRSYIPEQEWVMSRQVHHGVDLLGHVSSIGHYDISVDSDPN